MAKVGFIGLGNMGMPMAQNLLKTAHEVTGFDLNVDVTERLAASGGSTANSIADACKAAEVVVHHVAGGRAGARGLSRPRRRAGDGRAGNVAHRFLDIDVATAREVAQAARDKGSPWSMRRSPAVWPARRRPR